MNNSLITVRYARALFQLSQENKMLETIKNDIVVIQDCCNDSVEFRFLLESPMVKSSEKLRMVNILFKEKLNDLSVKFLQLLVDNKREIFLPDICRNFMDEYKKALGIKEASITTATALSQELKKQIFDYITNIFKIKIELNEKVDPTIIGGFILRIEDEQVNASIQSQLNKIKRELINS
jgi:F-type H+-transporting ATPase subunit delta